VPIVLFKEKSINFKDFEKEKGRKRMDSVENATLPQIRRVILYMKRITSENQKN
jgi:hypothetical protein